MLLSLLVTLTLAASPSRSTLSGLAMSLSGINPSVFALAIKSRDCAVARGLATNSGRIAIIDYSRPSTSRRLWVFDLKSNQPRLLFSEFVAHGSGSGGNLSTSFSNLPGSLKSSLGLFSAAETYVGHDGYSLRLDGLEPGINNHARARDIVMHPASYVDPTLTRGEGRLGRSQGCPALRPVVSRAIIDSLKRGLIFSYYPDRQWLNSSRLFSCSRISS
jgi:hypothetical protein